MTQQPLLLAPTQLQPHHRSPPSPLHHATAPQTQLHCRRHQSTLETSHPSQRLNHFVLAHALNPERLSPAATSQKRYRRRRRHHKSRRRGICHLHSPSSQARLERPLLQHPRPLSTTLRSLRPRPPS